MSVKLFFQDCTMTLTSRNNTPADYTKSVMSIFTNMWGPLMLESTDRKNTDRKNTDRKNFDRAISLLVEIALKEINSPKIICPKKTTGPINTVAATSIITKRKISFIPELDEKGKVLTLIRYIANDFIKLCETGFPFYYTDNLRTQNALHMALENEYSILFCFLNKGPTLSEDALNQQLPPIIESLSFNEIVKTCSDLIKSYESDRYLKGYNGRYFLWIFKQIVGCSYKLDVNNVKQTLSDFFKKNTTLNNVENCIKILFYTHENKPLYEKVLDREAQDKFIEFAIKQLAEISMEQWRGKTTIIIQLLSTLSLENRLKLASELCTSSDLDTLEIGRTLQQAMRASSLTEAIAPFYALQALLPQIKPSHIEHIFGRPFMDFYDNSIYRKDPDCTKKLRFTSTGTILTGNRLMIGIYNGTIGYTTPPILPHLLAYSQDSQKMVWGIPLSAESPTNSPRMASENYIWGMAGESIFFNFKGEKSVRFINPKTGETNCVCQLPPLSKDSFDFLHVDSNGFTYQKIGNETFIGGKITGDEWKESFRTSPPIGKPLAFSTHYGFLNPVSNKGLTLFGPTGNQRVIPNCILATEKNGVLYSIEKNTTKKNVCLLNKRELTQDDNVISEAKETIFLHIKDPISINICENGQIILLSKDKGATFIISNNSNIINVNYGFESSIRYIVDKTSATLWVWDELSYNLRKISSNGIIDVGVLESSQSTAFLHADQKTLYFTEKT